MDHCLLYGPDIEKVQEIFENVLGFYLVEHVLLEDGKTDLAIWLSCSTKAHDIAFVRHPEPGKLHHVAFLLDSWEKVLRAADIMSMNKVSIDIGPTRHGITRGTTIYAFDPRATASRPSAAATTPTPTTSRDLDVGRGRPGRLLPRPSAELALQAT
jgi:catechol 2,3-dioxygenase